MIEIINFLAQDAPSDAPKELMLLSFISQSFFRPFSLEDNLLAILSALTSGSGVGFNRAMLLLVEDNELRGRLWLGPRSPEEARYIWNALSTPGIGYAEIIEHNRTLLARPGDSLTRAVQSLSFPLRPGGGTVPSLATTSRDIVLVRDAFHEPRVEEDFQRLIGVSDFLCIPLLARDEVLGEVILDNAITRAPIESRDIKLASLVGLMAGNIIALARMHRRVTEMERLAAMGEMAAFITHELRNPLAAVGGFVEQMSDPKVSERKKKRNLHIIRNEVKRLEEILFKIAHLLKVEPKAAPRCDLGPVLESILADPKVRLKTRRKSVRLDLEEGLPPVLCDPLYTAEAIQNVLDNALDATPDQGAVSIRAAASGDGRELVLSITDSGPGIPESIRDKIFRPFFSTKKKGMGLGLLFVKRVMDAYGGRIEVEFGEGRGATFSLYFPTQGKGAP
jgi:signal transduction histidine kinase